MWATCQFTSAPQVSVRPSEFSSCSGIERAVHCRLLAWEQRSSKPWKGLGLSHKIAPILTRSSTERVGGSRVRAEHLPARFRRCCEQQAYSPTRGGRSRFADGRHGPPCWDLSSLV